MGMFTHRALLAVLVVSLLPACAEQSMSDLNRFVENTHKDRKPRVEPLPRIRPHETFVYTAANLTDPFSSGNLGRQTPTPTGGVAPDLTRRKEPLEQFPLDEGNFVGQNHGKITKVSDEKLDIMELVPGGNGNWVERNTNLAIIK
jgi:type IV pilus assembly protein PilP